MKHQYKSCFLVIALLAITAFAQAEKRQQINLQQQEIAEILAAKDTYAYFGPAICSLASDLPALKKMAAAAGVDAQHLCALAEIAAQGYTTAPADMVKAALEEAAACVAACKAELTAQELTRIADALEAYDQAVQSGAADVIVADDEDEEAATRGTKKFDNVVIRKQASIGSLYVGGDTIINHNLTVNGDELVRGNLTVLGETIFSDTSVTFAGDQIITGNLKVLENIRLPDALAGSAAQGILQLGVDPIYAFNMGTSNFFAGDYTSGMPATISTGSHNIAIGTRANIGLTTGINSVAIGTNSAANASGAVAVGNLSRASAAGALALGDGSIATGSNSVAIGTGTSSGVNAVGIGESVVANGNVSVALGNFNSASGTNSISVGNSSQANADDSIAIGRSVNGNGTSTLTGINSVAIGNNSNTPGANAIAFGVNAHALSDNSIAIGMVSTSTNASSIAIGNNARAFFPDSIAIGTNVITTSSGTFIGGIYNALVVGQSVTVNPDGQLGTTVSARRFKENFRSLDNHSAQIYNLNPVKFDYKAEHGGAKDQFGLIADDVAQHIPEIVVHDKDGEIYSVQYHVLPTLLLNEMKHHQRKFESQDEAIAQLRSEVAMLKAALQKSH